MTTKPSYLEMVYATLIVQGALTLEDVPLTIKPQVELALELLLGKQ